MAETSISTIAAVEKRRNHTMATDSLVTIFPKDEMSLEDIDASTFHQLYADYYELLVTLDKQVPVAGVKIDDRNALKQAVEEHCRDVPLRSLMYRGGPKALRRASEHDTAFAERELARNNAEQHSR